MRRLQTKGLMCLFVCLFVLGEELLIPCKVFFTYLKDSRNEVWWTIDGKKTDDTTIDVTVDERYHWCRQEGD